VLFLLNVGSRKYDHRNSHYKQRFSRADNQVTAELTGLEAIELSLEGWTLTHSDEHRRQWMRDAEGDLHASCLMLTYQAEPLEGLDLGDYAAVRQSVVAIAQQAEQTMVSLEMVQAATHAGLWYILKQKQAGSGNVYSGCMLIPMGESFYTLQLVCLETGITGIREAIIMDRFIAAGTAIKELSEGQQADDGTARARYSSDNESFDSQFPNHPLSRVRRYFHEIITALTLKK